MSGNTSNSRAAKVKDTDMPGSLAVGVFVTGDLDQAAFHQHTRGHVGAATSDGPTVQGGPRLGIAKPSVECTCPRVVVLHLHPRQSSTSGDDLRSDAVISSAPRPRDWKRSCTASIQIMPASVAGGSRRHQGHQAPVGQRPHQYDDLAGVRGLQGCADSADVFRPT